MNVKHRTLLGKIIYKDDFPNSAASSFLNDRNQRTDREKGEQ